MSAKCSKTILIEGIQQYVFMMLFSYMILTKFTKFLFFEILKKLTMKVNNNITKKIFHLHFA